MPSFGKRFRRAAVALAATAAVGTAVVTGLGPVPGSASSHREAPLVAADPQVDGTDLYAFVSPDKPSTTTIISNWIPFEEPAGGPNFYSFAPGVHYDINIDNNGDALPDIVYRWGFKNHYVTTDTFLYNTGVVNHLTDPTLNFYQTYCLTRIARGKSTRLVRNARVAPSDVGAASMPDYATLSNEAIHSFGATGKTWAGQADDPFFLDLRVFDLLYGANFSETGHDTLLGFNVNSFAIQVPHSDLTHGGDGSGVVGIWTTAARRSVRTQYSDGHQAFSGKFVQVSRLGMPLVNEVVIPLGSKDLFNASLPKDDAQFAPKVQTWGQDPNDLPALINAFYGIQIPDCDNDPNNGIDRTCDLVPVFLTGIPGLNQPPRVRASEMLRLNTTIPPCTSACSTLGVIGGDNAGFPNGRRLSDDIIDVSLRVTEGVLIPGHDPNADTLGDGVDANDASFVSSFPYLALPHSGSDANPHTSVHRQ
ncbi:MAG: DUF4331 domain-containing protein [Actinobacteria bacterium]|nr:MAG: DUF4331 domain-containing protein [Actinomycetota bacterium]